MWIEMFGWVADVFLLSALFLVSFGRIQGTSKVFNTMNLLGAVLLAIYAVLKSAYPLLVLEFFWGGIALLALMRKHKAKEDN